ncbi:phospholipase D3-like protein [Leptotrombidium deliense]|uniref:Phospholipase D3-like protein n=1 Tax=Leptotrombidium deliense TaxID=299467 RepID=A0A443RXX4_9ACAR|nr:phospholipase D3-like protein [Leptotrombidium deliense]
MFIYLHSLDAFYKMRGTGRIDVKLFTVPPLPDVKIPFSRVNHNKFMVTEKHAYIGTSNWSADYFVNTGGVGFVANTTDTRNNIRTQLERVFTRDWFSIYATFLHNN